MKIIVSDVIGFCPGVNEAVYACKKGYYCLGEVIHNSETIDRLIASGVKFINEEDIDKIDLKDKDVVIRAHGISPQVYEKLEKSGANIINKTCPNVAKVQLYSLNPDYKTVIIGDKDHPEIKGILGYAPKDTMVWSKDISEDIIKNVAENYPRINLIGQTTLLESTYKRIGKLFKKYNKHTYINNTLCPETRKRQKALKKLCKKVDFIIIVGDKKSANTNQLQVLVTEMKKPSIIVGTAHELPKDIKYKKVGIASGASTPRHLVDEVVVYLYQGS